VELAGVEPALGALSWRRWLDGPAAEKQQKPAASPSPSTTTTLALLIFGAHQ
jgi:hypothetical protein